MKTHLRQLVLFLLLVFSLVACTRGTGDTSKVQLGLGNLHSKVGASAMPSNVSHIVVNVKGDGMEQLVWSWDGHGSQGTQLTPPATIDLDVTRGLNRLIQVLLVMKSSGSNTMQFAYGDTLVNIDSDISVSLTTAFVGTSNTEGQVGGRYLDATGNGPTGELVLQYQPTLAGRPPMSIMKSSIINGWFKVFFLEGALFTYRLFPVGADLFSGIDITSAIFSPSDRVLHVMAPAGVRSFGNGDTESTGEERFVLGFFGPGAASGSKGICYETSTGAVNSFFTTSALTTPIYYDPTSTNTAKVRRKDNTGGIAAATSSTVCDSSNTSNDFIDHLNFDGKNVASGKARAFGFDSIFKLPSGQYSAVQMSKNASTGVISFSWNYLPGAVGNSGVDGVAIFASYNFTGELRGGNDAVECSTLENRGFTKLGETASNSIDVTVPVASVGQVRAVVCPYKESFFGLSRYYFTNGLDMKDSSGGSGGGSPATKLTWYGPSDLNNNSCVQYMLKGETASSQPGYLSTSSDSSVSISTDAGNFFSDPSCSSSISNLQFSAYSTTQTVFFKGSSLPSTINFNSTFGGLTSGTLAINTWTAGSATNVVMYPLYGVTPGGSFNITRGFCAQLLVQALDSNSRAVSGSLSATISATPTGSYFYTDSNCTSGASTSGNVTITSGQTNGYVYVKIPFADGNSSIVLTATSGGLTTGNLTMNMSSPGVATKLMVWNGNTSTAGTCSPVKIVAVDQNGNPAPVSTATTVNLSADSGTQFYASGSCTGTITSTMINTGYSDANAVYWRRYLAGTDVIHLVDATTAMTTMAMNITINVGSAANIIFVLPGQQFNPGANSFGSAVTLSPTPGVYTSNYGPVAAYVVDSAYNVVTTASGSCTSVFTSDTYDVNPSSVAFTNGSATFQLSTTNSGSGFMILGSSSSCTYSAIDSATYNRP